MKQVVILQVDWAATERPRKELENGLDENFDCCQGWIRHYVARARNKSKTIHFLKRQKLVSGGITFVNQILLRTWKRTDISFKLRRTWFENYLWHSVVICIGNRTTSSTICTSLVTVNHKLYEKVARFCIYSILNKITSINQNGKFYGSSVSTSETFETLRTNVVNLWKTLVEPWTPSKFFGSTSETFKSLRVNFGNLRKSSGQLRMYSEDFGRLRKKFLVNFGKKSNWYSWEYNLGFIVLLTSNQNPVIL